MFAYSFAILAACQVALAATITYDWTAEWVTAAPDGFERPVIGINGEWPCPTIDANVGDTVVVNLQNNLGNQSTSIHWHGMHQRGTGYMDGATGATQCPLAPGDSMTYEFVVRHLKDGNLDLRLLGFRPIKLALTGTTRTISGNILMVYGAPSLSVAASLSSMTANS